MDSSLDKKLLGFNKIAEEKLQNIFCTIPGKKDLIIETILIKPLEHVCGAPWLRTKGIDRIYKFDQKNPPQKRHQIIYFISSNLITFKHVLDQIHSYRNAEQSHNLDVKDYHVIIFPTAYCSFQYLLEEEGLYGLVGLHRFQWDFLTLDTGILSLEIPNVYRDVFIKQDYSVLSSIAQSIRLLNIVARKPKMILCYGENSERVLEMCNRLESYNKQAVENTENADFTAMIIIDRNKDYPSCLLTPVVYAGFLAELYKINAGIAQVDNLNNCINSGKLEFLQLPDPLKTEQKNIGNIVLNSNKDMIYNEHKYSHFSDVITNLSAQAKLIGMEKDLTKNMKISEMKDYVKNKLQKVATKKRELFKHLILCETIMTELGGNFESLHNLEENMLNNRNRKQILLQIDEILSTNAHKYNTIRLICLFHITIGLSYEEATSFIKNYCNAFGYQYLSIFSNLAAAKIFPDTINFNKIKLLSSINLSSTISLPKWQNQFQTDANKLKLLPLEDVTISRENPTCPSYAFNGIYIPLIAQLANFLIRSENFDDLNNKLGHLDEIKISGKFYNNELKSIKDILSGIKRSEYNDLFPLRPRTIFIFVVGGLTYAEIAACNLIEKLTSSKIVVASNCILSGSDTVASAFV